MIYVGFIFYKIGEDKKGDNMTILIIRTLILVVVVMAAVRLMGKRTIGELQASEFVVTLLISDLAAVPMQETGIPLLAGIIPIAILVSSEIIISSLIMKSPKLCRLVNGSPVIVIRNGEIDQGALRKLRMTNEDLFENLRKNGIFRVSTVKYAIVETDGVLSVLQYSSELPVTNAGAGVAAEEEDSEFLVVSDGNINEASMSLAGVNEKKIKKAIKAQKLQLDEVFIMTATPKGELNIIRREKE